MKKASVVGAGFAGLTVALRLAEKGFSVDLYEKSSHVGGLLGTDHTEFGISEKAANALIRTEASERLFKDLGLEPSFTLKDSRKRFLLRGRPRQWPLSIFESLKFIIRFAPVFLLSRKNLKPQSQQTLKEWGEQHLGSAPTQYILEPAMQGIYGNEISDLSASLILGGLFQPKKKSNKKYRGLLTGPGGMQDLVDKLEEKLLSLGVKIHLNSEFHWDSISGPVVIATNAKAAAEIVRPRSLPLSQLLQRIPMSSILSATLFFEKPQSQYRGFGCLIPRGAGIKSLGVLMNSYIFSDRSKFYNETWMLGGIKNQDLLHVSDQDILKLIAEERFRVLGAKEALLDYRINRWPAALPFYNLELEQVVQELKERPSIHGLYLHGNYLEGIGLSKILERSERLAQEIESDGK